jgi:leader peptidase (prepilin peptidase)/N-methyltransferase
LNPSSTEFQALAILLPYVAPVFGLLIGSFLNVCIVRLPKEESVVAPRSHCPNCGHAIAWYENIPLLSFLALRGKCRGCGTPISWLYFTIELITAFIFWAMAILFGPSIEFLKYSVFGALMLALVVIDLRDRILPDELTRTGFVLGVGFSLLSNVGDGTAQWMTHSLGHWPAPMVSVLDSLLGAAAGAGALWLVREAYFLWRGVEGMGFGDLKLMAAAGAFLGIKVTLLTILLGSFSGSILGGGFILLARNRDTAYELPFGTFLGAAAMFGALWGKEVVHWYLLKLS